MGIGNAVHVELDYLSCTTAFVAGPLYTAKQNQLRADALDVPQTAYERLQDTWDNLLGCGGLAGHGVGEDNEITSTGTVYTIPADSVWLIKEALTLTVGVSADLATPGTYYTYLKWDGTNITSEDKASAVRPTSVPAICVAKIVSNGATLTIDQDAVEVDVPTLNDVIVAVPDLAADSVNDTHIDWGTGTGQVSAGDVPVDASGFAGNLSITDTDVQTALDTIDAISLGTDAFTVKVDAAATAGYLGTVGSDGVLRCTAPVVMTDGGNYTTLSLPAASDTVSGHVELATAAETTTGTDATRAVTPDGLAGSNYGKRSCEVQVFAPGAAVAAGNGAATIAIPDSLDGYNLVSAAARTYTVGTGSTLLTIQLRRRRDATDADMLSTRITVDAAEYTSLTAATPAVIEAANDDVQHDATNGIDLIEIDVDAVPETTPQNGLWITMTFQLP